MNAIGQALNRVDGPLKVCGMAPYAADFKRPDLTHGVLVTSTVASGRIARIDADAARTMPGVLLVMTPFDAPRLPKAGAATAPPAGRVLSLLQDDVVHYNGQPVAVVVADTFERATEAARLLRITYAATPAQVDFERDRQQPYAPAKLTRDPPDSSRGDLASGLAGAARQVQALYTTPIEHHNPMEPHGGIAWWEGDRLFVHDSTQFVTGVKETLAKTLGLPPENVVCTCPFVGGGFGSKGSTWSHVALTAMAARQVGRPVKLVLQRPQMFGPVGNRPRTEQTLRLAAAADGRLVATKHEVLTETSQLEDWTEPSAVLTRMLYACDNVATSHRLLKLNIASPTFTRAPGEASGSFALECALDELAYELDIDPLALRLANHAESDADKRKPFSSKSLRECYRLGAERFGWSKRPRQAGTLSDGRWKIGYGMATATYPTNRSPASARAVLLPDGRAQVFSGTQDLGTGAYTIMTQVAADALGLPVEAVRFGLGDSRMPKAPVSGGSQSTASVSPAVRAASLAARDKLVSLAMDDPASPLRGASRADIVAADGRLSLRSDPSRSDTHAALLGRHGQPVEATADAAPGAEKEAFSMHAFGAVFVEVRVDAELGIVRVPRIVGTYGVGRLLNAKTGRSQLMGGIVWGVSMALFEETWRDPRDGRHVNANLADYHVASHADIGSIEVEVVPEDDPHVNPLGAKGIGEIGITGVPAAIANAVSHATGRRVRSLPITLDKLL